VEKKHPIADKSAARRNALKADARIDAAQRREEIARDLGPTPDLASLDEADRMALAIELIDADHAEECETLDAAIGHLREALGLLRVELIALASEPWWRRLFVRRRLLDLEKGIARTIGARVAAADHAGMLRIVRAAQRGSEAS
jgi:hypothetical protein